MRCKYSIEDIDKYIENNYSEEARIEFENHLKSCEDCKRNYAALELTEKFSNSEAHADRNFHVDILGHLDNKRYSKNKVILFKLRRAVKPVISIAACLTIIFTSFAYKQQISRIASNVYNTITQKTKEEYNVKIFEKDKVFTEFAKTAVISPCSGKQGPGEEYDDIIDLPYGRMINIVGRYSDNIDWFVAKLIPGIGEKETEFEFWINFDNIDSNGLENISFENCRYSEASMFNNIIVNAPEGSDINLRILPDENSAPVDDVTDGDRIKVIRKDSEWSLVKKLIDNNENFTSYTGWIQNKYYTPYKKGMYTNQGFVQMNTKVYENPDENSPASSNFKVQNLLAPVVIESAEGEWFKISSGQSEVLVSNVADPWTGNKVNIIHRGWIKSSDLITTFDDPDLFDQLVYPEIDKADFSKKLSNEILNSTEVTLNAYDINSVITLTQTQKALLSQKLTSINDFERFEGGILYEREAIYPFYSLEMKVAPDSEQNYILSVAGDDKLVILIPQERYKYYGYLNSEASPIRFIKVNKEFVECIRSMLPPPANNDKDNINYLLNAENVHLITMNAEPELGTGPQIYKCARTIKKYMGNEIKSEDRNKNSEFLVTFEFVFSDSSSINVTFYKDYILYNDKYYSVKDNPENIVLELFAGYF